jgi:hypothetical protein
MGIGQVIPVVGTLTGFVGEVSRTGGGNPLVVSKIANANNTNNITVGDALILMPDSTGGSYRQFADFIANGGVFTVSTVTTSNTTLAPTSLAGLSVGMLVIGSGIPAGAYITAISPSAGTVTISKAATASATVTLSYGIFAGFAVRETKTQLGYPYAANGSGSLMTYLPAQYVGCLVRGSITVINKVGTPVAGGQAWIRAILNGSISAGIVGGLETNSDTVNNVPLGKGSGIAEVYYKTGNQDTNGVVEISVLSQVTV